MTIDEQTVQGFYEALRRHDAASASDCYRDDATFRDLAFDLTGKEDISAMWRLVCSRKVGVDFSAIRTEGAEVKARWIADYRFRGKRPVHYSIESTFTFRDGKILRHVDSASRWTWAKQALGFPTDIVVTVFPPILRKQAREELEAFKKHERLTI